MEDRNKQIHCILQHIEWIEAKVRILRQLVTQLSKTNVEGNQNIILVDAKLVTPVADAQQPVVLGEARAQQLGPCIVVKQPSPLTRCQIHEDGRWRTQN